MIRAIREKQNSIGIQRYENSFLFGVIYLSINILTNSFIDLIRQDSRKPRPDRKEKFMWQRVGDGSGRRAQLFRSGYSTLAGIKKENKKLN